MKNVGMFVKNTTTNIIKTVTPVAMEHVVQPATKLVKTQTTSFIKDSASKVKGAMKLGVGVGVLVGASKAPTNVMAHIKETNPNNPVKPPENIFRAEDSQNLIDNVMQSCKTVAVTGLANTKKQLETYGSEIKKDGIAAIPNVIMRAGLIDAGALARNVVIDGVGKATETVLTEVGKAGVNAYREYQDNKKPNTEEMARNFQQQANNTPSTSSSFSSLPLNKDNAKSNAR